MLEVRPHDADLGAWAALAAEAVEPNPFFEPELVLPAVRNLPGGEDVRLLVAQDARGRWIGAAPVVRARRWKGMPALVHATWVHPYCFLGLPLLAAGHEEEAAAALVGQLRRRAALVPLENLPAGTAVTTACAPATVWNAWERAMLRRRESDNYVESTLAVKRRRELRRLRARFEDEHGEVMAFEALPGEPDAVEAFLRLEASGWKGRAGTALHTQGHAGFFREMCASFAATGRLQLVSLRAGDHVLAMQCNLRAGRGAFCFKLAVDETYARYSPGVQLQIDNVHFFHASAHLQWEDSCADPSNTMINRLWPDRRQLETLIVPGTGALGGLGRLQAGAAAAIRHRRKEHDA